MKNRPYAVLVLAIVALVILPSAFAQETTTGFQGTVKDPSGAVIAGATVEVSGPALIGTRTAQTDASGTYRFTALPVGQYTVTVKAPGFRTYRQTGIELSVGRLPSIDLTMQVGAVAETVEVTSEAPAVDVTQSKVQAVVNSQVLNSIPKGRSFQTVIAFAPGARQEPLQSGGNQTRGTAGFQIDGASDGENVFMIDGVNTTNIVNGGVGKSFQMDFIDEVVVKSSSFEAEYGGALGGVINAVGKHGSNAFHGAVVTYLNMNKFNADDCDRGAGIQCTFSLRIDPVLPQRNTTTRLDGTPQYYFAKKDDRTILEPGYLLGGAIKQDKLWFFSSYIPTLDTTWRTTTFTGLNPGPRRLSQTFTQHNAYNRLDYAPLNSLRFNASWNYGYSRTTGALGGQDSAAGQRNSTAALVTGSSTDPNTLRSDVGSVNPLSVFSYGADWTPTSKLVVSARYGYFFNNNEQRGTPTGIRYVYSTAANSSTVDLAGQPVPTAFQNSSGYANIPSNLATAFDAYKRDGLNVDLSYFAHGWGSHSLKGGFFYQRQSNVVLRTFNTAAVNITWASSYSPATNNTICDPIIAANRVTFGVAAANAAGCTGRYGYFTVGTGVVNTGGTEQTAKALYFQDAWNVGHGLTLNLGLRFDNEVQPAYDPARFPSVNFGWGSKIAPRIGGAYDLLHNGKIKIYASYGQFYDIMKMGLARGSFGSDYWHNCVYAMDDPDYTKITPTYPIGGGCPATGPAPGVTVGRFIENNDLRATKADSRDPALSPDMKPMKQHEFVTGLDWAINKNWTLETRYSRKRLDETIEDMAITDNLGFYIGNPGSKIADVLHRPTVIPNAAGVDYLNTTPFCAECPPTIPAVRRFDGLEFRLIRRPSGRWFTAITYDYSKLRGNYPGLTNSDPTDGTQGRHSPNNSRLFDLPTMTYLPGGGLDDGPLSTDRPHTAKIFGSYTQPWGEFMGGRFKGNTTEFGLIQIGYQGTPINSCLPVVGGSSACQWAEGRGNFVNLTRAANGDIVKGDIVQGARSDNLLQTDLTIRHVVKVREGQKIEFELNIQNLFNQRNGVSYYEFMIPTNFVNPTRASRFSGDPQVDWGKVMNGFNYIDALNGAGAFGGAAAQPKLTLAALYGLPTAFQTARSLRLMFRYTF